MSCIYVEIKKKMEKKNKRINETKKNKKKNLKKTKKTKTTKKTNQSMKYAVMAPQLSLLGAEQNVCVHRVCEIVSVCESLYVSVLVFVCLFV